MGKNSQPQTTTTIQKNEPDPLTQQWRSQIYGLAQDQYNQGMPGYFPGSTVVPFSDQTQAGLNYMQDYASQGAFGLPQAQGALNNSMSSYRPGMDTMAFGASGGMQNPFGGMSAMQGLRPTTAGMNTLQQTANGDMIGQNPYMDRMAGQISDRVNAQFAQAGRYGSNAHTEGLTSGLSDLYSGVYNQERANQLGAANSLGGFQANDLSRGLQGLGMAGQFMDTGYGRQLDSAGMLADTSNTANAQGMMAAGMLPGLYNYGLMPADTMLTAGSEYENLAAQYLAEAQNRYNYDANAGRSNVSWLADMMNGLPTYGTTTGTMTQPVQRRSPLQGAAGGAAMGASVGSIFPGIGTVVGAGIGAVGGAFAGG